MKIKMYQVDAFTEKLFGGNPAAVCFLDSWLEEVAMQAIAAENNLAETAFIVKSNLGYDIRWFTPTVEVDLCGHATLAAAHVVFDHSGYDADEILFYSERSGMLKVKKDKDLLTLDLPTDQFEKVETPEALSRGLGIPPLTTFLGKTDYMCVFASEKEIEHMLPDFAILSELECRGIIVTAHGTAVDFVSRFFAPQSGINEDPVTGSAHTTLTPYWARTLGKKEMTAIQVSARRGYLTCRLHGQRVEVSGHAVTYLEGEITVN